MSTYLVGASYPLLALVVLVAAVGAPLPLGVALAAAGALARQGHLNLLALFAVCVAASIAGDSLGYAVGRFGLRRLARYSYRGPATGRLRAAWIAATGLHGNMGLIVFFTRWALTVPAPFVNILAGMRRYPLRGFLVADVTGEMIWGATALVPGYVLGGAGHIGIVLALAVGALSAVLCSSLAQRLSLQRPGFWQRRLTGASINTPRPL